MLIQSVLLTKNLVDLQWYRGSFRSPPTISICIFLNNGFKRGRNYREGTKKDSTLHRGRTMQSCRGRTMQSLSVVLSLEIRLTIVSLAFVPCIDQINYPCLRF